MQSSRAESPGPLGLWGGRDGQEGIDPGSSSDCRVMVGRIWLRLFRQSSIGAQGIGCTHRNLPWCPLSGEDRLEAGCQLICSEQIGKPRQEPGRAFLLTTAGLCRSPMEAAVTRSSVICPAMFRKDEIAGTVL